METAEAEPLPDNVKPRYVGNKCPECNNSYTYDPVPLYISLIVLFLIILLLGFMYIKYLLARKETQMCMAFRHMDKRTREKLRDLIEDDDL
jgi:hypothetical protein